MAINDFITPFSISFFFTDKKQQILSLKKRKKSVIYIYFRTTISFLLFKPPLLPIIQEINRIVSFALFS